jgi:formylglycine-generating enzyme required for sulfatase activity
MLDVFVSYSRSNSMFVQRLTADLDHIGKNVWFDKKKEPLTGIPTGSRWWDEIKYGIENADNFLIVISPESMASPYCHAEIAHAIRNEKRIVPLLYCVNSSQIQTFKSIDNSIDEIAPEIEIPESVSADISKLQTLARRNWRELTQYQFLPYLNDPDWNQWLRAVVDAVDLNIEWIRMWSQFRQAVKIWVETDYDEYERWTERRLEPIREAVAKRQQQLTQEESLFLLPEQARLYRELENINIKHQQRYAIGERLSTIGDTRKGVGVQNGLPNVDWLPIAEGGEIQIEHHEFSVRPFFIAKYLTTLVQFQIFLDSDWGNQKWWKGFPEEYQPQEFGTVTNGNHNAPRDTVSWYQGVAFTRWMNEQFKGLELELDNGTSLIVGNDAEIRLPTEQEWQWVAQNGAEGRDYPWGNWDEHPRANTSEAGNSQRSTSVGIYPHGQATCGAQDMSGNLMEWCLNNYSNPETINDYTIGNSKVLRGGAFSNNRYKAHTSFRSNHFPN